MVISAPILTVGPAPNNPPRGSITISDCTTFHGRLSIATQTIGSCLPAKALISRLQWRRPRLDYRKAVLRHQSDTVFGDKREAPIISLRGYLHVTYIAAAVDASYCPLVSHFRLKFTFFTTLIIWIANGIQLEGDAF